MCALTITMAISTHNETHLVPLRVGIEWWAIPLCISSLHFLEVGQCYVTSIYCEWTLLAYIQVSV